MQPRSRRFQNCALLDMSTKTRDMRQLPVKLVKKVVRICALNCIPVNHCSRTVQDNGDKKQLITSGISSNDNIIMNYLSCIITNIIRYANNTAIIGYTTSTHFAISLTIVTQYLRSWALLLIVLQFIVMDILLLQHSNSLTDTKTQKRDGKWKFHKYKLTDTGIYGLDGIYY